MIPKIKKITQEKGHILYLQGYKWIVKSDSGCDATFTLSRAIRYWLWHCGVPAKIAFWGIRRE